MATLNVFLAPRGAQIESALSINMDQFARSPFARISLVDLPLEVLHHIVGQIDDKTTLHSLALTCHLFAAIMRDPVAVVAAQKRVAALDRLVLNWFAACYEQNPGRAIRVFDIPTHIALKARPNLVEDIPNSWLQLVLDAIDIWKSLARRERDVIRRAYKR